MILVLGGCYQGKTEFVRKNFAISEEEIFFVPDTRQEAENPENEKKTGKPGKVRVINGYHRLVHKQLLSGEDPVKKLRELLKENPDLILISDEIGMGIVPMDRFERDYREAVGKVLCAAAKEAKEVYRVMAGIGEELLSKAWKP